tara:strand:+ start:704 stop:1120 length:417 start_codon:yes stop_codon:yes gene_type:complete
MSILLTNLYSQLSKKTEGSNKFYNIHVAECTKGQLFRASNKTATQNGYEVYSIFGKIDGTPRQRHIGFFFSESAAMRSADRTKESKKQKGYVENGNRTYTKPAVDTKSNDFKPIFDPIPIPKLKMTQTQKSRFSDLID